MTEVNIINNVCARMYITLTCAIKEICFQKGNTLVKLITRNKKTGKLLKAYYKIQRLSPYLLECNPYL